MIFEFIMILVLLFIIVGLIYQFMYDIYLLVLMLSFIFCASYITVKLVNYFRTKKIKEVTVEKEQIVENKVVPIKQEVKIQEDKDLQKLKDFVSKNLKQGFKPEVIKEALAKQGWSKEKIEQAFK